VKVEVKLRVAECLGRLANGSVQAVLPNVPKIFVKIVAEMSQKQVGWRLTVLLTTGLSLSHVTTAKNCNNSVMICKPGLLLPVWEPKINIPVGAVAYRAIVYFAWLCYFFLGVSIVSDRFMSAIEVITSKEREMKVRRC